jgi:membrane fusion protein (multidrug efflux system)
MSMDVVEAIRALKRAIARAAVGAFKDTGVGPQQFAVLHEVRRAGKASQAELARATFTDPAALMRALDSLERRGWVRRSSAGDDRRRKLVSLTPAGRRALVELDSAFEALRAQADGALSSRERKQFCSLAAKLASHLEAAGQAAPAAQGPRPMTPDIANAPAPSAHGAPMPRPTPDRTRSRPAPAAALLLVPLALLAACGSRGAKGPAPAGPVEVGVVTLAPTSVTLTRELPGRTSAFRVAEVRARVNGIVLKRLFAEGSDVREGQALFAIDPAPYVAALEGAKAQLARAEANAASARMQGERYGELVAENAVSRQEYENAMAALKATEADVAAGRAAVQAAQINLGYTKVTAPVSGRIGRSVVTEGAYVQQAQATLLAVVQQLDPMYVDLTQSSADASRLRRALADGKLQSAGPGQAKVRLVLEDGREYAPPGTLQFADVTVDPSTGSIALRALFPNPRGELLPGTFVRARLDEGVNPEALLVPQQGVTRDQKGLPTALVVGADGKVERRQLVTDRAVGDAWLVTSGLRAGDRVIVEGLQKVQPGAAVTAVPAGTTKAAASR